MFAIIVPLVKYKFCRPYELKRLDGFHDFAGLADARTTHELAKLSRLKEKSFLVGIVLNGLTNRTEHP